MPNNSKLIQYSFYFLLIIGVSFLAVKIGPAGNLALSVLPMLFLCLIVFFQKPELILFATLICSFLISLLGRYVPGIPFGLSIDGLQLLSFLALIFHKKYGLENITKGNAIIWLLTGWLLFTGIMLFNPESASKIAWFYANRGLSIYPLLFVGVTLLTITKTKQLNYFLMIWAVCAVFGTLWGLKQLMLGVSLTEQHWLNAGAASTHILFGKLRVFSFFSDSAQFGANQAHTSLVFGIIGLHSQNKKWRYIWLLVSLIAFIGMMISGTRGVLAVLAVGGMIYLIMSKRIKIVVLGVLLAIGAFCFLKYTMIGQSNYQINRMRTALDTDDPSFKVRQERVNVLSNYLSSRPLGGGIGSAGFWGKRFAAGSFLAEIGTDGHYTRVWMETGKIGLSIYILMLLLIAYYLGRLLWHMEQSEDRSILIAFYSGFVGLCVASYTNGLITQLPTGALTFTSIALIYLGATGRLSKAS
ncbi:MAG: hypothetical protein ACI8QD_001593 [Cyclobacteriaceae bacterium]|jgi:hypothetical protein